MKTTERFERTVKVLYTAFHDGTLDSIEYRRILNSNYFVTSDGVVFSNFNKSKNNKPNYRILSQHYRNGYLSVRINIDGTRIKHYTVHYLVLLCFKEKPKGMDCVNHINGIKDDNRLVNLEWSNSSLNMLHAYRMGLMVAPGNRKGFTGELCSNSIPVIEYDINGNKIKEHVSLKSTKKHGYRPSSVSKNCKGKTETYKGRVFRFKNDPVK